MHQFMRRKRLWMGMFDNRPPACIKRWFSASDPSGLRPSLPSVRRAPAFKSGQCPGRISKLFDNAFVRYVKMSHLKERCARASVGGSACRFAAAPRNRQY